MQCNDDHPAQLTGQGRPWRFLLRLPKHRSSKVILDAGMKRHAGGQDGRSGER
jgi:hypothetical protein